MRRPDVEPGHEAVHTFSAQHASAVIRASAASPHGAVRPITPTRNWWLAYRDRFGVGERADDGDEDDTERLDDVALPGVQDAPRDAQGRLPTRLRPRGPRRICDSTSSACAASTCCERRARCGVSPECATTTSSLPIGKALLRRRPLPPEQDWLPAYVVKGEGIYFELDPTNLAAWEARAEVQARADRIANHYGQVITDRGGRRPRHLSPRMIMLHTFAHLLINELVFACGYSSASLRERLYVSRDDGRDMAGLLIYTAAGDSEGTMGGLVRMARPDHLQPVFAAALSDARWCSTDPVCMDAGEKGKGRTPATLRPATAAHCLPETSCEEFNRFLDRGLVHRDV